MFSCFESLSQEIRNQAYLFFISLPKNGRYRYLQSLVGSHDLADPCCPWGAIRMVLVWYTTDKIPIASTITRETGILYDEVQQFMQWYDFQNPSEYELKVAMGCSI